METLNVNLIPGYYPCPVGHASLNDSDRTFRLNLYDDCVPYTLDGTESLTLRVRKVDGSSVMIPIENPAADHVNIVISSSLTDIPGKLYCKLGINNIRTKAFYIDVES